MTNHFDWEPAYGFCGMNESDPVELAQALEMVRRRVCSYGAVNNMTCDCKYGINESTRQYDERNGCPELREVINRLLHRPETLK